MTRSIRAGIGVCFCTALVSACGADTNSTGSTASSGARCAAFHVSRSAWNSGENYAEDTKVTPRQRIADRITECDSLKGMTYVQVVALLGKPDERNPDPLEASYWLGDERSPVQVDSEYLDVQFGAGERVETVRITQG